MMSPNSRIDSRKIASLFPASLAKCSDLASRFNYEFCSVAIAIRCCPVANSARSKCPPPRSTHHFKDKTDCCTPPQFMMGLKAQIFKKTLQNKLIPVKRTKFTGII